MILEVSSLASGWITKRSLHVPKDQFLIDCYLDHVQDDDGVLVSVHKVLKMKPCRLEVIVLLLH